MASPDAAPGDADSAADSRRTAILRAVWEVVATRGIAGVSVRAVATAAAVSPGLVQHHFPTKQALVRAGARHMIDAAAAVHRDTHADRAPEQELRALLVHALPRAQESRAGTAAFYSFIAAGVADPQIAAILAEAQEGVCVEVARLVGLLGPAEADPADTARRLLALSDGLTQAVFLGHLPAAQAEDLVDAELARLTRADPANIA